MEDIIAKQHAFFNSGQTLDYHLCMNNLDKLYHVIKDNETMIADAIYQDLHKSAYENV